MLKKTGSKWEGQVMSVASNRHAQTNIPFSDVAPYLKSSKIWFDVGLKDVTVRGVATEMEATNNKRVCAYVAADGYIWFSPGESQFQPEVGAPVYVNFRV